MRTPNGERPKMTKARLLALLRPTKSLPRSDERIGVYAARAAAGENLQRPGDANEPLVPKEVELALRKLARTRHELGETYSPWDDEDDS